jgi:hypothetical protein
MGSGGPGGGRQTRHPGGIMQGRRFLYFLLALGAVVGLQAFCLEWRIPAVSPASFAESAEELKVTPKWRYGYVCLWHGAVLVKTRNRPAPAKSAPRDAYFDADTHQIMQRQLATLPRKAAWEIALYAGILWYLFWGWPWLTRALLAAPCTRGRLLLAGVLGWTGLWLVTALPLPLWGYGTPLVTNCLGPGALSASGLPLGAAPAYSSTVSYHGLLTCLAPWMLLGLEPLFLVMPWLPHLSEGLVLWLGGLVTSVTFGFTLRLIRLFFRRRPQPRR